jgi:threonine dehydrogenase-like Zn-dependent dehydrogenase
VKLNTEIPKTQKAVQLIGPDELKVNENKGISKPGPYQILAEVEAVGLCFSDLKLLKQFTSHVRKSEIVSGIDKSILKEIPSYVPGELPTVPGHEAVVRIVEVGEKVTGIKLGGRFLVQTDYRWLPTANSNAAFGYNFEGGLQQFVLMDQRVITSSDGESMLIPASDKLSASAIALVEPWACVEDAYAVKERTTLKENGQMLVVAEEEFNEKVFAGFAARFGKPGKITLVSNANTLKDIGVAVENASDISALADASFDDVIYFGSRPETVESLFAKVAASGLLNIVLCGGKFGRDISAQVGRVHYGNIRIIGTAGDDPSAGMEYIPASGEIRRNDKIDVVGAAGPMGVMHVVRDLCQGVEGVKVYGGDLDDDRLGVLGKIAEPIAAKNGVEFIPYNPSKGQMDEKFDYVVIMAPVGKLVAASVGKAAQNGIINIFAGIPATVNADIDLDGYIEKQLYFIGTSGSVLDDMKTVLKKVEDGSLDTNISVGAICGIEDAIKGIRAVENHSIAGKIIVYPSCRDLQLTVLESIGETMPDVNGCLEDGLWNKEAESVLLNSKT